MSIGEIFLGQTFKVGAVKNNSKVQRTAQVEGTSGQGKDNIEISSIGRDLNVARNAVKNTSDIREDLVSEIKSRYQSGQYEVNTSAIAEKLLG